MISPGQVRVEWDGCVATLVIDNPARRHAMTEDMWAALPAKLKEAEQNARSRVILIAGGGKDFSTGADVSQLATVFRHS